MMNEEGTMMSKHTPGPWEAREYKTTSGDIWIDCVSFTKSGRARGGTFAIALKNGCGEGQLEANARLIAAAPELLEACEAALRYIQRMGGGQTIQDELRAAVEKARAAKE